MIEKVDFGDPLGALGALDTNEICNACKEGCKAHNSAKVDSTYELNQ